MKVSNLLWYACNEMVKFFVFLEILTFDIQSINELKTCYLLYAIWKMFECEE